MIARKFSTALEYSAIYSALWILEKVSSHLLSESLALTLLLLSQIFTRYSHQLPNGLTSKHRYLLRHCLRRSRIGIRPAVLEANPTLKAQIQALVEAQQLSAAASATPASTATESTPLPATMDATPVVFTTTEPPTITPTSDDATPAVVTSSAPPPAVDTTSLVITEVLGSLAEETATLPPPQRSSPPPQIAPLPTPSTAATLAVVDPPSLPHLTLPISSVPPTSSTAITLTPLHRPSHTEEHSPPPKQSKSQTSSSATKSDDHSPPKPSSPQKRITRGTLKKRKATASAASSKTAPSKRGRRNTTAIELFPDASAKPSGPSLPECIGAFVTREVIPPLIIGQEFWRSVSQSEFDIAPVVAALERCGWMGLADAPCAYDLVEIITFYAALNVIGKPPNYDYAVITWKGMPLLIDAELIAEITELSTGEGFCDLQKKSGPHSAFCIRKRMKNPSNCKPVPLSQFTFSDKLLHQIIVNNVAPRLEKRELIDNCDQNLMGHVFAGETIDTQRVILRHMLVANKGRNHPLPYPLIVKKIMEYYGMYKPIRELSAENILSVAMLRHLKFKDTLEVSPSPSPEPSPPALRIRSKSSHSTQPEPQQKPTQPATSKEQYVYDQLPVPRDLHESLIHQTPVNVKILQLLEEISLQIAYHHKMTAKQLSHIRVLLASPAPPAHIGHHLPNLDPELQASEEGDPADAAKDQGDVATGVAEGKPTDIVDTDDETKQT